MEPSQFAGRTQLGAEATPQVDRAAMVGPLPERPTQRRHHVKAVKEHRKLGSLLFGKAPDITMPQHLRRARARWEEEIRNRVARTRLAAQ